MKESQIESGRSMVEMLGVLAIIGVLSVGGIAGYKTAMERMGLNNTLNMVNSFALFIDGEIENWDTSPFNQDAADHFSPCAGESMECACRKERTTYFCDLYGQSFCTNYTGATEGCYYGKGYGLGGSFFYQVSSRADGEKEPLLMINYPPAQCESLLMGILSNNLITQNLKMYSSMDANQIAWWNMDESKIKSFCSATGHKVDKNGNRLLTLWFYTE